MSGYSDDSGDGGLLGGLRLRTVATAASLLAGLCLAFLAGRASHGTAPAAASHHPSPSPSTATPSASSAGGERKDPTSAGADAPHRGPLRRNSAGVIVDYSHDQQGAAAAAGNYTASLYVQKNRTHARELTVLRTIATSLDTAARLADDFTSEDVALSKLLHVADLQTPGVIAYGHPVGYRVEKSDGASATVDVYVVGGQGVADAPTDSGRAGETFYEVDQVELSWQSGDWRLNNWSHLVQNNGPELATVAAQGYSPFPIGQTGRGGARS